MTHAWPRPSFIAGFGLAGALLLAVAGCGGKGPETDDAVVIADPTAAAPTAAPATWRSTAATPAAATGPRRRPRRRPTSRRKDGGRSRAGSPSRARRPRRRTSSRRGRPPRTPSICAKDEPIKTAAPDRRRRDQGGQERPGLHPQADRGQSRGQGGRLQGRGRVRPEEVHLRAPRARRHDRREDPAEEQRPGQPQRQLQAQEQRDQPERSPVERVAVPDPRGPRRRRAKSSAISITG